MIFKKTKDGGPLSPVDAFFLCEFKNYFSIALLRFNEGGRESFHSHAFNAYTWFLWGDLEEQVLDYSTKTGYRVKPYKRRLEPKVTSRDRLHRVKASKPSWCFTVRGPWVKEWKEVDNSGNEITLGWGRVLFKKGV
tara:strand:- start:215 stop:622 length:408 start_codon:yes stop_codon:yes gene_type:complete